MQRREDNVAARLNGNALQPLSDVAITVTDDKTGLPASLYSDNGVTPLSQPLMTDNNGYYGYYAANGEYTETFTSARIASFTRKTVLADPDDNPHATKAELAAGSGATLVSHNGESVASELDALQLADYAALRAYAGNRKSVYVTGYLGTAAPSGIAGMFVRDDSDTTSADDGAICIVAANSKRWKRQLRDAVHIEWFGAKSDARLANGTLNPSPTNSQPALQAAIKYAVLNGVSKVTANAGASYYCGGVTLIPTLYGNLAGYPNRYVALTCDFQGAEFVGAGTASSGYGWMESAYFDASGNMVPTYGLAASENEKYLFSHYVITNAQLTNFARGVRLKNWVFGCEVRQLAMRSVGQAVVTKRSYYCRFDKITNTGAVDVSNDALANFEFNDNNNIMPLQALVTGNHKIGYLFTGGSEAMRLVDCGAEGCTDAGVITRGQYNIKFDSCYFENVAVGVRPEAGIAVITFDNCWGYGNFPMFATTVDNANVNILPNNQLGNGCRWFDTLPGYNTSTVNLPQGIVGTGTALTNYAAPDAVKVSQALTVFDAALGLTATSVYGRAEVTSKYHAGRYTGKYGRGWINKDKMIGTTVTIDALSGGYQTVHWQTSIDYSDTQCIYAALQVAHNNGTWQFFGFIVGNKLKPVYEVGTLSANATINNIGGKVELTITNFPSGGSLGVSGGEIRLI